MIKNFVRHLKEAVKRRLRTDRQNEEKPPAIKDGILQQEIYPHFEDSTEVSCLEKPEKSVTNNPSLDENGHVVTADSNSSVNGSNHQVTGDFNSDKAAGIIKTDSWSVLSARLGKGELSPGNSSSSFAYNR